jgi:outer membrane receptor protein involved in Fe transport
MTYRTATSALALAIAFTAAPAVAAETERAIIRADTIIVTTQKREENIQDVPIAVTAYTGDFLAALGIEQFDDLALFVPGLEIQEQSPNNPGFVIRGITSDDGAANQEARVSVFQDGVSISRSRGAYVELHDMERIEAVKGPQSTLFGRGALIGAVSLIQRKADVNAGLTGDGALALGNLDYRMIRGAANLPILDGTLAARVSVIHKERDGYIENALGGADFMSQDVTAARFSLRFEPTEALRFDLIYNIQQDTPSGTSFKSGAYAPPGGNTLPWTAAGLSVFDDPVGRRFMGGRDLGVDRTVQGLTLLSAWDINDAWSLNAITGWRTFDSVEVFDPDGFAQQVLLFAEDAQGDQFSQEFRLNYDAGGALAGFAGVSFFREKGSQLVPLQYDERGTLALFGALTSGRPVTALFPPAQFPNFPPNALLGQILTTPTRLPFKPIHVEEFQNWGQTLAWDAFADGTIRFTPKLEASAGVRFTRDDKTTWYRARTVNGPSTITGGGLFAVLTPNGARLRAEDSFDAVTWRAALRYQVSDAWNVYVNAARGRRPEVVNYNTTTRSFQIVPAEIATSYEAGVKGLAFDNRLQLEAALYRYEYENFQTNVRDGVRVIPINAGNATTNGFELSARFEAIEDRVQVFATYGWNEGRFDDTDSQGRRQVFAGNSFRLSPDHTASAGAFISFPLAAGEIIVTPTYTWQSEVFFDNDNRADKSQDSYGLANLRIRFEPAGQAWAIEAFGSNLADEDYIIDAGNTGDVFGIPTFIAGPPRTFGVQASVSF